jgi:hypothetical protein
MTLSSASDVEVALARVGEVLRFRRQSFAIAIVGGAALNLIGAVSRTTTDVDVLAVANPVELARNARSTLTEAPNPLPVDLVRAAADVARDLNLDEGELTVTEVSEPRNGTVTIIDDGKKL